MTVNGSMAIKILKETTMSKVKDLVSVHVESALCGLEGEERYELLSAVGSYLRNVVQADRLVREWEDVDSYGFDPHFVPYLKLVYYNFYMGVKAMSEVKFAPPGCEVSSVTADRAQRAICSIADSPVCAEYSSRAWDKDEFESDAFIYLWMELFVRLVQGGALNGRNVCPKGQGGIP